MLRLEVDALSLKRAVIDPRIDIEFSRPPVDVLAPAFAPFLQKVGGVPVAVLLAEPVLTIADRLRGEAASSLEA